MKQIRTVLFLYILAAMMQACFSDMKLDLDEVTDRQIVVNSVIYPDTTLFVSLTYTKFITDTTDYYIPNARVEISDGDTTILLHYRDSGIYVANYRPKCGKEYFLRVQVNDTILTAHTKIPPDTALVRDILYRYSRANRDLNTGYNYTDLYIVLDDPNPGQPDYYEFAYQEAFWAESNYFSPVDEPYYYQEGYIDDVYPTMVLSDNFFPGFHPDTIHLKPDYSPLIREGIAVDSMIYSFWVIVRKVSDDYYKYMKSYYTMDKSYYSYALFNSYGVSLSFKPIGLYSNIQNGLGIFAGFCQQSYLVEDTVIIKHQ